VLSKRWHEPLIDRADKAIAAVEVILDG
jgi:hypothetical protein